MKKLALVMALVCVVSLTASLAPAFWSWAPYMGWGGYGSSSSGWSGGYWPMAASSSSYGGYWSGAPWGYASSSSWSGGPWGYGRGMWGGGCGSSGWKY